MSKKDPNWGNPQAGATQAGPQNAGAQSGGSWSGYGWNGGQGAGYGAGYGPQPGYGPGAGYGYGPQPGAGAQAAGAQAAGAQGAGPRIDALDVLEGVLRDGFSMSNLTRIARASGSNFWIGAAIGAGLVVLMNRPDVRSAVSGIFSKGGADEPPADAPKD